jgi:hypothetical protein
MPAPLAGALLICCFWVRGFSPCRTDHQLVYVTNLRKRRKCARSPLTGRECLAIHPLGGISIAADFEVFTQLLGADGAAFTKQNFDLLADQRIALNGGGVMGLLIPDVCPDALSLFGRRESTKTQAQFGDLLVQACMNGGA